MIQRAIAPGNQGKTLYKQNELKNFLRKIVLQYFFPFPLLWVAKTLSYTGYRTVCHLISSCQEKLQTMTQITLIFHKRGMQILVHLNKNNDSDLHLLKNIFSHYFTSQENQCY